MRVLFLLLLSLPAALQAKSLGISGEVFPVVEQSFLSLIESRLRQLTESGEWDAFNQRWQAEVSRRVLRPKPLNLPRAQRAMSHYYRPEVRLNSPLRDAAGHLLYAVGTRVNALQDLPTYQPCWLFFNQDDKAQQRWALKARQQCTNPKLILTGGAIDEAEVTFKASIYFDQAGRITTKLKIHTLPAKVTRAGNALLIQELAIKESGDGA